MSIGLSSQDKIEIRDHFRVAAGPGAGKTTWLVSHIKNVLQNSSELGRTKKVSCITYTNVAVETILRRLDFSADKVEVSTIHSFIYKHIVKPYASFIDADYGLAIAKVDGHDEHLISHKRIVEWLNNHVNVSRFSSPYSLKQMTRLDHNMEGIVNWLSSLSYKFNGSNLELVADDRQAYYQNGEHRTNLGKVNCLDKLRSGLIDYKKMFWSRGILHHEDVLFFGYKLLQSYPFILKIICAKFPYFYIDEFQDTSPIQTAILKMIANEGAIVGIIGDKAQSIYGFQGSTPQDFVSFSLPNLKDYTINDNWRSTNQIVNLLNHVRRDIAQNARRGANGAKPTIIIGDTLLAYNYVTSTLQLESVATLSWDNVTANSMKRHVNSFIPSHNLIDELMSKDSNSDRRRVVISCMNALELAKQGRFKEAMKEMSKNFRQADGFERKKRSFSALCQLLSKYADFENENLTKFYDTLKANVNSNMARFASGAAATFYNSYKYSQVATGINIADDDSLNRTIHRAKGDEFDNVMLILKNESSLNFAISPNLSSEAHRLYYVAISRAKQRLFINVPTLDSSKETTLSTHFDFIRL